MKVVIMCKQLNYDWIYSANISDHYLHLIKSGPGELSGDLSGEFVEYLLTLFGPGVEIPTLSPITVNFVYRMLQDKNVLKTSRNKYTARSSSNSIYNFAVAKAGVFNANIKILKGNNADLSTLKNYANLLFSTQQTVEVNHVAHITEQTQTLFDSGKTELLHYISESDGKVRREHKEADGTILPMLDEFWNTALKLLAQFNCRCNIVKAPAGVKMNPKGKSFNYGEALTQSVSDIDLRSGKAGVFKETLPVFQNADPLIRKYYRKLDDSIFE